MRGMSSLAAAAAIAAVSGGVWYSEFVMPAEPQAEKIKTNWGRNCVAQAKRAALKLRRQKSHRMHCRGRK